jgi:vacuolar-type H+-ATPase subunit E/Vma4
MSLESILKHILDEAGLEREKIIQEAKSQHKLLLQEAGQEAEKFYQEMLAREKARYEAEKQKLIVNARLGAKRDLLAVKQELIDAVFEKVKSQLKREEFKKEQIAQDKVRQVAEDLDFYLKRIRPDYETDIAKILFG